MQAFHLTNGIYTSFPRGGVPYSYIGKTHFRWHMLSASHLTPSLFLHASQSLLLPPLGLLHLLVQSALVEVLHHHSNKHVQHEETDNQEKGDEVQQHPGVVIGYGLKNEETERTENERVPKYIHLIFWIKSSVNKIEFWIKIIRFYLH